MPRQMAITVDLKLFVSNSMKVHMILITKHKTPEITIPPHGIKHLSEHRLETMAEKYKVKLDYYIFHFQTKKVWYNTSKIRDYEVYQAHNLWYINHESLQNNNN